MRFMEISLQAVLSHIANALYADIHFYDPSQNTWTTCVKKLGVADPLFEKSEVKSYLLSESLKRHDPLLVQINSVAVYSLVRCSHGCYLIGPVQLPVDIKCLNQLDIYPSEPTFYEHIRYIPMTLYVENVLLLHNLFHEDQMTLDVHASLGQYIYETDDKVREHVTHSAFGNREELIRHNPFDNEVRDLKAIEEGRLDLFDQLWRDNYHTDTISLLSRDPVRAAKYLTIMSVTLASRASIRGGVLPETALTLCDSYVLQIDELKDPRELESIARSAWINFAYLASDSEKSVSEHSDNQEKQDNPIITKCEDYVFLHLHEKISVNQIADELDLNPTYLTNLFKKYKGISLYQFILNEKINMVKNLLTYSTHSYIDIANYLAFSSQSHLSQVFKRATGMSPKQYRNMYGRTDKS